MSQYRVLIVDDDLSWQENFHEVIESLNAAPADGEQYRSWVAGSYEEAESQLNRRHFHLALIDLRLQKKTELEGKKIVQKIKDLDEGTSTIVITGFADATTATELLKELDVFYLFEKEKPLTTLVEQIKKAVSKSQVKYRARFNSAMDFLKGNQDIHSWAAEALQAILGGSRVSNIDDLGNLRELLNDLLTDLYPLLPHQGDSRTVINLEEGMVGVRCWSKALGVPVFIKFGLQERLNTELKRGVSVEKIFARVERTRTVKEFGGVVYIPVQPPFAEFCGG